MIVTSYGISTLVKNSVRVAYEFAKVYPSSLSYAELCVLLDPMFEKPIYFINKSTVIEPSVPGFHKLTRDPKSITVAEACRPFLCQSTFTGEPTATFFVSVDQVIDNLFDSTTLQHLLNRNEAELKIRSAK